MQDIKAAVLDAILGSSTSMEQVCYDNDTPYTLELRQHIIDNAFQCTRCGIWVKREFESTYFRNICADCAFDD